jgi:thiol-disulfide isomerase/thioredoxin
MFKLLSFGYIIFLCFSVSANKNNPSILKIGDWTGRLQLTTKDYLPFKFHVEKTNKNKNGSVFQFSIINGAEVILLKNITLEKDSLRIEFPSFNSQLILKATSDKQLIGYWQNFNKGVNYKIPCVVSFGYLSRFSNPKLLVSNFQPAKFNGKWETTFEPNTDDSYKALGVFKQNYTDIEGTFLTETGDYRFLEGNVIQDSLYLSCFDGSHAFLFSGKLNNGEIDGRFFSGKHWETNWKAIQNEGFELIHPDSLTRIINEQPISFKLKDLNGVDFIFPKEQFENKVTIIQIMGTWCPNCMDETRYLKDLYSKYHQNGLEIISIGYEVGETFEEHAAKIAKLKERLSLDFIFLVGGKANKDLASQQFNMLSRIISFPTAIIIGKDGLVKKIHTGFNGPGTDEYYTDFIKSDELFIKSLLFNN